jgi:hypothetical protein
MNRIKRLVSAQLLCVPISSIHESETRQWQQRKEALDFIKTTCGGYEFERHYRVERVQVLRSFRSWLRGEGSKILIDRNDVFSKCLDRWDDYIFVDVEIDRGDGSDESARKKGSAHNLVSLFDDWTRDESTFNSDFKGELAGQAQIYLKQHLSWFLAAVKGDLDALMTIPVVEHMRRQLPDDVDLESGLRTCREFFQSEHFQNVRVHSITCRAHAALKRDVKIGAYANRDAAERRLRGYYTDLAHVSHYAPYCDAIAVDKVMAELLKRPGVDLAKTYGINVFSLSNKDAFHAWLDEVEKGLTTEHQEALRVAYD